MQTAKPYTGKKRAIGDQLLSLLMGCFVGTVYFLIEVVWKTFHGNPQSISWTMLVLALLIGICMERLGASLPWHIPIWVQGLVCGLAITALEFFTGCLVNLYLGWNVWDYSHIPGNILGQIAPPFAILWCLISTPVIVLLDWIRYSVRGGARPVYCWKFKF
jgi:uncharacterized membrane protein